MAAPGSLHVFFLLFCIPCFRCASTHARQSPPTKGKFPSEVHLEVMSKTTGPEFEVMATDSAVCHLMTDLTMGLSAVDSDAQNTEEFFFSCNITNTIIDCSRMGLSSVPQDLPSNVTHLDLSSNVISSLPDSVFIKYSNLLNLNLSSNRISYLNNNSFCGLSMLQSLDLWNNSLELKPETYPDDVFMPLQQLTFLRINGNSKLVLTNASGLVYPDKALLGLENLTHLSIDGISNSYFGHGFSRITHLTVAGASHGYCNMCSLHDDMFAETTKLEYLDMSDCSIQGSPEMGKAFEPLTELKVLNISYNEEIHIYSLSSIFHGLRNSQLKNLSMQYISNRFSFGVCLSKDNLNYSNFPSHLEYLEAGNNNFVAVDGDVIRHLPPALKYMDLSGNPFAFGAYLKGIHLMKNLKKLRLSGGGLIYTLPDSYPFQLPNFNNVLNNSCTPFSGDVWRQASPEAFILKLPPNLSCVEMNDAGLTYIMSKLEVDPDNKLKILNLHGNKFPRLEGPLNGLNNLKTFDLSACHIQDISDHFFINLTSLINLNLEFNMLGNYFSQIVESGSFSMLENLTNLNLASNYISDLPTGLLKGLHKLKTLRLDNNRFTQFSVDISHLEQLELLNLTRNFISILPSNVRAHIDRLLQKGVNIQVEMAWTPIFCDCSNLEFLEWMTSSKAFDPTFSFYLCSYPDSYFQNITDGYNTTIQRLRRECASNAALLSIVTLMTLTVVSVIVGAVIYRFRWKLRYLYYAAYLHYKKSGRKMQNLEFEFDAFICYHQLDESFILETVSPQLERRGLKLCIHGRDFTAGYYIASNIVKAVCSSRKTLVILTRHMIDSYWCAYEVQMAKLESIYTGRHVLVFLLKEDIPHSKMNKELLYNIRSSTYIPYHDPLPDADSVRRLWDKVAADLKD